jgi:Winged helix DNA-binding domain
MNAAEQTTRLVLRYLAAFGPASPADAQRWSGLTRLAEVFAGLRDRLVEFRTPDGTVLYDLPDAPRPDPETPAPVRFLPSYDNLLLGHDNRRRVNPHGRPVPLPPGNGADRGTVLVDGTWHGEWRTNTTGTLTVTCFAKPDADTRDALEQEGLALLQLLAPDAEASTVQVTVEA